MLEFDLPRSILKTSDSSKNNNIFGNHKGKLKKSKFSIITGLILILGSCLILHWISQGVRWVHVPSGKEESPFIMGGAAVFCIFIGLWFIIDYFKTPSFDIYENGLIIGKEEVLYNQIKKIDFVKSPIFNFVVVTADRKIKYTTFAISKLTQSVLQQIAFFYENHD